MVQETFLRALRGFATYRGRANPKTWLCSIARNVAIDFSRKNLHAPVSYEMLEHVSSAQRTPEEIAEAKWLTIHVLRFLQTVSPKYRTVVILRGIQDMSPAETAEVLGWSKTKVNVAYHRAMKMARQFVTEEQGRESVGRISEESSPI